MIKRVCDYCKKEYKTYPSTKKQYCSLNCWNKAQIGRFKGNKNPMWKIQRSKKWKEQHSKFMKKLWRKRENPFKGKKHKQSTKEKMSLNHADVSKNKNPRWLGGISRPYAQRLMENKNYCENCGIEVRNHNKHIHHIDQNPQNNNKNNLMILCAKCHKEKHLRQF